MLLSYFSLNTKRGDTILEPISTPNSLTIIVLPLKVSKLPRKVLLPREPPNAILYYHNKYAPEVILFVNKEIDHILPRVESTVAILFCNSIVTQ